jgi:hypothetical protein
MLSYDVAKAWLQSKVHTRVSPNCQEDFDLMSKILEQHPNFINWKHQTVEYYIITRSPKKKALQVLIKFEGLKTPRLVSWVACVTQKIRKIDQLTQSMRSAIAYQMTEYRTRHPVKKCALCECDYEPRIEVDHYPILFSTIKKMYLEQFTEIDSVVPKTFRFCQSRFCFKQEDMNWQVAWEQFHLNHARYRYLCDKCNQLNK